MNIEQNEVDQLALFDYASIDTDTTNYLKQNARETRGLLKRTTEDIIQIGKNLLEAKARLPHGQFTLWVIAELGISQSTSWRFMQTAQGKEIKGKSFTVNDLMLPAPKADNSSHEKIEYTLFSDEEIQVFQDTLSEFIYENKGHEAVINAWKARYDFLVLSGRSLKDSCLEMLEVDMCDAVNAWLGYIRLKAVSLDRDLSLPDGYPYPLLHCKQVAS